MQHETVTGELALIFFIPANHFPVGIKTTTCLALLTSLIFEEPQWLQRQFKSEVSAHNSEQIWQKAVMRFFNLPHQNACPGRIISEGERGVQSLWHTQSLTFLQKLLTRGKNQGSGLWGKCLPNENGLQGQSFHTGHLILSNRTSPLAISHYA